MYRFIWLSHYGFIYRDPQCIESLQMKPNPKNKRDETKNDDSIGFPSVYLKTQISSIGFYRKFLLYPPIFFTSFFNNFIEEIYYPAEIYFTPPFIELISP